MQVFAKQQLDLLTGQAWLYGDKSREQQVSLQTNTVVLVMPVSIYGSYLPAQLVCLISFCMLVAGCKLKSSNRYALRIHSDDRL